MEPEEDQATDNQQTNGKVIVEVFAHDWDQVHRTHHLGKLGDDTGGTAMTFDEGKVIVTQREGKAAKIGSEEEQRLFVSVSRNQPVVAEDTHLHEAAVGTSGQVEKQGEREAFHKEGTKGLPMDNPADQG